MTDRLAALFADVLDINPADVDDETAPGNTEEWDSLANMVLLASIEEQYVVEFSSEEILEMKTFGKVRELLTNRGIDPA